jgi:hypothetical protein
MSRDNLTNKNPREQPINSRGQTKEETIMEELLIKKS